MTKTAKTNNVALVEINNNANPRSYIGSYFDPLGVEYIAGKLSQNNADVSAQVFQNSVWKPIHLSLDDFAKKIIATNPDIVGFSTLTYNFSSNIFVAEQIKKSNPATTIIFGSEYISALPEEIGNYNCINYAVIGEGEETMSELVDFIANESANSEREKIKGIAYKENGQVIITPRRSRNKSLDSLPFPKRTAELLAGNFIENMNLPISEQKTTQTTYSRGCPYQCSFCTAPSMWQSNITWRSPNNVVDEIKELQEKFGINTVLFSDLSFNVNPKKVEELCDAINQAGVEFYWQAMARIDRITPELLEKMHSAGCRKIAYGIETFESEK